MEATSSVQLAGAHGQPAESQMPPKLQQEEPTEKYLSLDPKNIIFHELEQDIYESRPHYVRDLVRPPVVRQWLVEGKLHRERIKREQSRFELFFDLVFVAFAHLLSDAAAETANGSAFLKFVLTFYPAWSLWSEFRTFMNQSGTDDVTVRLNVLFLMAVLVGYSANASAIRLGDSTSLDVSNAMESAAVTGIDDQISTSDKALVAAAAFFIVGRGSRVPLQLFYAWRLPRFAQSFVLQALLHSVIIVICCPLLWVTRSRTIIILASFAMAMDFVGRFIPMMIVYFKRDIAFAKLHKRPDILENLDFDGTQRPYFSRVHIPAINIEHHIERTVSFVIIVFGELVISVVYHAATAAVGLSQIYGRAVLGLIMAFNLAWIYWDVEASGTFVHALRRHWLASILWNQLHWPLCGSLILASAALSRLVLLDGVVSSGHRWYFGGGLGSSMIILALIGAVHRSLEPRGLTRLNRTVILSMRAVVGVVICCLPLVTPNNMSATSLLAVTAGLTTFVVVEETYGKLHNLASLDLDSDTQTVVDPGDIVDVEVENVEIPGLQGEIDEGRDLEDVISNTVLKRNQDLRCSTWRDWMQMEKACRERVRAGARAKAEGRALTKLNRGLQQWQYYQAECRRVNPLAGACAGG